MKPWDIPELDYANSKRSLQIQLDATNSALKAVLSRATTAEWKNCAMWGIIRNRKKEKK